MKFPEFVIMYDQDQGVSLGTLYKVVRNSEGSDIPIYDFKVYYHTLHDLIRDEISKKATIDEIK